MAERHFVKYTFLKVDPAWRRLPAGERAEGKREFIAACEDFGADHLLQSFSLIGTRGDCDLMLVVAFDTDDAGAFLDLVQRLRTTEASAFTQRDTPSFTCINASLERAVNALDGEALTISLT